MENKEMKYYRQEDDLYSKTSSPCGRLLAEVKEGGEEIVEGDVGAVEGDRGKDPGDEGDLEEGVGGGGDGLGLPQTEV